jgi:hypothetical protein
MGKARDRRERRRNRKFNPGILIIAVLAVIGVFLVGHFVPVFSDAYADNIKCEDDHTCYWAEYVGNSDQPKSNQCRHNENSSWAFIIPLEQCGENDEKEEETNTPAPQVSTATDVPKKADPTSTAIPTATKKANEKEPTATLRTYDDPGDEDKRKDPTVTATVATFVQQEDRCEWCEIAHEFLGLFSRLVEAEEQETDYMATQVSK